MSFGVLGEYIVLPFL